MELTFQEVVDFCGLVARKATEKEIELVRKYVLDSRMEQLVEENVPLGERIELYQTISKGIESSAKFSAMVYDLTLFDKRLYIGVGMEIADNPLLDYKNRLSECGLDFKIPEEIKVDNHLHFRMAINPFIINHLDQVGSLSGDCILDVCLQSK